MSECKNKKNNWFFYQDESNEFALNMDNVKSFGLQAPSSVVLFYTDNTNTTIAYTDPQETINLYKKLLLHLGCDSNFYSVGISIVNSNIPEAQIPVTNEVKEGHNEVA